VWLSEYRYYASLTTEDGRAVGDAPLDVDWVPAEQCAYFEQHVRQRALGRARSSPVRIEPVWKEGGQPPVVRGVRISATDRESTCRPQELPLGYFHDAVVDASSRFVEAGRLAVGQRFRYEIFALPDREPKALAGNVIVVEETSAADPAVETAGLDALMGAATAHRTARRGTDAAPDQMPVFVPERVLGEATEIARSAGDVEAGGILVGRLCRDASGTVFVVVTAQIAAEHTVATRESLRFTPATWAGIEAALALRGRNESILGWQHSHPFFCELCPPERRRYCALSRPTFSVADRSLHREVFQRAWNVALLLSFLGGEMPSYDVFGWRLGRIEPLDFYVVPEGTEGMN
jgi:proteasome lid subunit RPN8/RPN11